jgi:tRNA threonylcarbamoyladenosine modification (KEOPS) complex  Pcc1 subunit
MPESVSLEHWQISPEKASAYLKTNKWKKVVEVAAKASAAKATASSGVQPKP